MRPLSRDVPAGNSKPGKARAEMDSAGVFAALDKVVAETPLATRLRTEGAPAASTPERFDSMESRWGACGARQGCRRDTFSDETWDGRRAGGVHSRAVRL